MRYRSASISCLITRLGPQIVTNAVSGDRAGVNMRQRNFWKTEDFYQQIGQQYMHLVMICIIPIFRCTSVPEETCRPMPSSGIVPG